jgi:preprotein translocase subunit SecG
MTDTSSNTETQAAPSTDARPGPRLFWVGMAVFLILIVFLGFGSTYGRQLVLGLEIGVAVETDWMIHLHAAASVGWLALLLGQAVLAARGRMRAHMALGKYGAPALGTAVVVAGSLIYYQGVVMRAGAKDVFSGAGWPTILVTTPSWIGLLGFVVLMGLGLRYRRRPAAHKRYMTLATMSLVSPAFARMSYLLGSWAFFKGIAIMVAPLLAYDLYTERRVRPATLIGTGFVVAPYIVLLLVAFL